MQKEMIEMIEQSTETALDAARKMGELNMRTFDAMFKQQVELAGFYMDAGSRSFDLAAKAKGYQDLMASQIGLMRECGERGMDAVRSGVAFANDSAKEYGALIQEGMKLAQEQIGRVSSQVAQAA